MTAWSLTDRRVYIWSVCIVGIFDLQCGEQQKKFISLKCHEINHKFSLSLLMWQSTLWAGNGWFLIAYLLRQWRGNRRWWPSRPDDNYKSDQKHSQNRWKWLILIFTSTVKQRPQDAVLRGRIANIAYISKFEIGYGGENIGIGHRHWTRGDNFISL